MTERERDRERERDIERQRERERKRKRDRGSVSVIKLLLYKVPSATASVITLDIWSDPKYVPEPMHIPKQFGTFLRNDQYVQAT